MFTSRHSQQLAGTSSNTNKVCVLAKLTIRATDYAPKETPITHRPITTARTTSVQPSLSRLSSRKDHLMKSNDSFFGFLINMWLDIPNDLGQTNIGIELLDYAPGRQLTRCIFVSCLWTSA